MAKITFDYGKEPASIEANSGEDKVSFTILGNSFYITSKNFSSIMVKKPGLFSTGQLAFMSSSGGVQEITYNGHNFFMGFTIPKSVKKEFSELVDALKRTGYRIVQG